MRRGVVSRRDAAKWLGWQRVQAWSLHSSRWWIAVRFFGEFFGDFKNIFGGCSAAKS
jgi:hypothetical protein